MLSLRIKGSRPRDPLIYPSRIARRLEGYTHRVCSHIPSGQGIKLSLSTLAASARNSRACLSHKLPIDGSLKLILGSLPAFSTSQGLGVRRCALSHRGSGAPQRCPTGMSLSTAPPIGSRTGRDIRRIH
jgi:hypothetical protein